MDHGNPTIPGRKLWFCSDEHVTFSSDDRPTIGDRVRILPGHIDPTVAYHEMFHVVDGEEVVEQWPIDMRGW
jgi:D-serine deaminase-like pyridoxal phosphate-dependent protein